MSKPYLPSTTFEQVLHFVPADPSTHTASPLVNAVAAALYETRFIEAGDIANYLKLDQTKLTHALSIELGMTLIELVHQYRLEQARQFVEQHPDMPLDQVASSLGYASRGSLWRFFQRKLGQTARGEKSHAGPERFNEMRRESRYGKRKSANK